MPLSHLIALISNAHPVLGSVHDPGEGAASTADTRLGGAL